MKIAVIGYSGAGKSILARKLGEIYNCPVLYLDTVQFIPGWKERDLEEGKQIVIDFMKNDSWVIDGNYNKFFQNDRLKQADKIVFLNFNRFVCLFRAYKRYYKFKNTTRESMVDGCNEKIDLAFIKWILFEGRNKRRREHFKQILKDYPKKSLELKNRKQVDSFIAMELIMRTQSDGSFV